MALTSVEGSSKLNPNAPLFIPAAYQVEDFSPEWWDLVTNTSWYCDYWLSLLEGESNYYSNGEDNVSRNHIADLLPEAFDLESNEEVRTMEAEFEEFIQNSLNEAHQTEM